MVYSIHNTVHAIIMDDVIVISGNDIMILNVWVTDYKKTKG